MRKIVIGLDEVDNPVIKFHYNEVQVFTLNLNWSDLRALHKQLDECITGADNYESGAEFLKSLPRFN